jgi:hypothetical protein
MRSEPPPLLARWLLQRLYSGPNAEAVFGDLLERYQASPSSVWYWRQVVTTIVVSLLWAIRAHKMLVIRAVLIGYAVTWLLGLVGFYLARGPVGSAVETLFGGSRHVIFGNWGPLIALITFAGAGWTVGRLHPQNRGAMVLAFASSVVLMDIPELRRLVANALAEERYVPALYGFVWTQSSAVLGILLGGLSQSRSVQKISGNPSRRIKRKALSSR